jgi:uncharacterized membrane protein
MTTPLPLAFEPTQVASMISCGAIYRIFLYCLVTFGYPMRQFEKTGLSSLCPLKFGKASAHPILVPTLRVSPHNVT